MGLSNHTTPTTQEKPIVKRTNWEKFWDFILKRKKK